MIKQLIDSYPTKFGKAISHTTREPKEGETNGVQYHFISREEMEKWIEDGKFLEHAEIDGNLYGTSLSAVRDVAVSGKLCILGEFLLCSVYEDSTC